MLRHFAVVGLVVAIVLSACGSGDPAPGSGDSPAETTSAATSPADTTTPIATASTVGRGYQGPLRFDWPTGCVVAVTESVDKGGNLAKLTYGLRVGAIGDDLEISLVDIVIVEINGASMPASESEKVAAQFSLPSFVVGRDGVALGVTGIDQVLADLVEAGVVEAGTLPQSFIATIEETVLAKYWMTWAGFWASEASITDPRIERTDVGLVAGTEVALEVSVESLEPATSGAARLRSVQTLSGDDFARSLGAVVSSAGGDPSVVIDGRRTTTIEVTTDPFTLRPRSASFETAIEMEVDGRTMAQSEERHWTFDWPNVRCE